MKPGAITKTVNDTPLTEQFYKQLGLRKPLADQPFAHARSNAGDSLIGSVVRPYHEVLHSFGNDTMMAAMYAERARKSGPYHHVKCYYNAELGKVV